MFRLRAELTTYNEEFQTKLVARDVAQQNGLAALRVIAADAATEIGTLRGLNDDLRSLTDDANSKLQRSLSRWAQRWQN